jgi:hypothetical protein
MIILQRERNDTSALLDLIRAIAAQMVCVGHAMIYFHGKPNSMRRFRTSASCCSSFCPAF